MAGYYLVPRQEEDGENYISLDAWTDMRWEDRTEEAGIVGDKQAKGQLVLIATPIGNLADITLRALSCLASADLIACEDTRHSLRLLDFYGIKKPLISYHAHNEEKRSEEILDRVEEGDLVALISDAGLPAVSDPGAVIINKARERGLPFTLLPGPSAGVTAQVLAGLGDGTYVFRAFLPRKGQERRKVIEDMEDDICQVFYEAPHRIRACISELGGLWPDRDFALIRELTKKHEECIHFKGREADTVEFTEKGEFVVVLGPMKKDPTWDDEMVKSRLFELEEAGLSGKDIIKKLLNESGRKKNDIYSLREEVKEGLKS